MNTGLGNKMNHNHGPDHHHQHSFISKKRLIIAIIFNLVITISEYIGGILSGSLALISDAGHNLSDVFSLILGYIGERISERKPTRRYSFGFKRTEVLIALLNSLILVLFGVYILYEAVERYINPQEIDVTIMLPIAIIGLLGNVFSILVLSRERGKNLNMRAVFLHLFYDAMSSVAVITVGSILIFTDLPILDLVISGFIAVMIIWSSFQIIKNSLQIVLQGAPDNINADKIYSQLLSLEFVREVHGLHIWSVSSTEVFLSCHLLLAKENGMVETDGLIRRINTMLEKDFGIIHTTIQIEHSDVCDPASDTCCR